MLLLVAIRLVGGDVRKIFGLKTVLLKSSRKID